MSAAINTEIATWNCDNGSIMARCPKQLCIRHMGANFYDHFKKKDLKNMFKRLCTQNQRRKFNALWQMLDQLTAELVKVRASGAATSQAAEARDSIEKSFSHWIRGAPKEKWSFLYDTNGIRYGIQTTNHAECLNMVMRSCGNC